MSKSLFIKQTFSYDIIKLWFKYEAIYTVWHAYQGNSNTLCPGLSEFCFFFLPTKYKQSKKRKIKERASEKKKKENQCNVLMHIKILYGKLARAKRGH